MDIRWVDDLDADLNREVRALLNAARDVDGWPDIGEDGSLPREFAGPRHLLGFDADVLVGYGHLAESGDAYGRRIVELIVHPERRRRGHGGAMFQTLGRTATGTVRAWSHGDHPAAAVIAANAGFTRVRELLRMGADLTAMALPTPELPPGVRMRTFVPGKDEQAVVDVNAAAFADHPEQGALTVDELVAAEREEWFDADGLFIAEGKARVHGFHWTKVHRQDPPVGEVYVVGVDPRDHGAGLGKALTSAGLAYLRSLGLDRVMLYVEGDNAPAIAVYAGLGFRTESAGVQYESPAEPMWA